MPELSKLEAALAYASWGWHVLPVLPNSSKAPATKHGVHDATTDQEKIKAWWGQNPNYNIGVAGGSKSGVMVYDIDPKNGGHLSWEDWTEDHGEPDCMMQITANRGRHYVAVYDNRVRSSEMLPGVDLISDGRYFVVSPSSFDDKEYVWEADSDPFDGVGPYETPDSWIEAINARQNNRAENIIKSGVEIITGGRNAGMASMAGALRNSGLNEPEILAAISVANEMRCSPPLPSSELRQIARSVSRYTPESDVTTDGAKGSVAALSILENLKQDKSGFYFTRASSFLTQPAPVPWVLRKWMPQGSSGLIYGPSGVGKSFIAVDMACSIVSGREWCGVEIECKGPVVYMAGEGNWGMRQRIASWCKHNECTDVCDLLVSSMPIDVDSPGVDVELLHAIRSMTEENVSVIFIDTLNRHMSGDENSAQDIRKLNNVCSMLSAATGATCILIHHTGNNADAKGRERGSSAIRASADFSIYVSEDKDNIKVACAKLKDGRRPDPFYVKLEEVDLGWVDDRGVPEEPGAVVVKLDKGQVDDPEDQPVEKDSKDQKYWGYFQDSFYASGREIMNKYPYVSKSFLKDHLIDTVGMKPKTAANHLAPGSRGKMIHHLIEVGYIKESMGGWFVIEKTHRSALLITSKG